MCRVRGPRSLRCRLRGGIEVDLVAELAEPLGKLSDGAHAVVAGEVARAEVPVDLAALEDGLCSPEQGRRDQDPVRRC